MKSTLGAIINTNFDDHDSSWIQPSLPVKLGGHGIWSAVQLAPLAFLAFAATAAASVRHMVLPNLHNHPLPNVGTAMAHWSQEHDLSPPQGHDLSSLLHPVKRAPGLMHCQFHPLASRWPMTLLHLGSPICKPHQCAHCEANVDSQATHGLSCR